MRGLTHIGVTIAKQLQEHARCSRCGKTTVVVNLAGYRAPFRGDGAELCSCVKAATPDSDGGRAA